jgi:hypothetical protein
MHRGAGVRRSLAEANLRERLGVIVLALHDPGSISATTSETFR